jgi:thiosulfate/3-mercaptopyruvate sulfurtransferase
MAEPDFNFCESNLVETDWLAANLKSPELAVIDASFHLPKDERDAVAEYEAIHIPGAVFFDIREIADTESSLPNMLPSPEAFSAKMESLGIGNETRVVAYDSKGLFSAARAWWMFRAMGHNKVAVLNGGLKKWQVEDLPVTDQASTPADGKTVFTANYDASLKRDLEAMKQIVSDDSIQIADARGPGRFLGSSPEPRENMRAGHMPGATNIHYATLLNDDGTVKSESELKVVFESAGIDLDQPIVATCGSGVTAGIIALTLATLGRTDVPVYDGSWAEWGNVNSGGEVIQ